MEMAWDGWRWLNGSKADLLLWVQLINTDPFTLNVSIHAIHFPSGWVAHPLNICIYTTLHLDLHLHVIISRSGHSFRNSPEQFRLIDTTNAQQTSNSSPISLSPSLSPLYTPLISINFMQLHIRVANPCHKFPNHQSESSVSINPKIIYHWIVFFGKLYRNP